MVGFLIISEPDYFVESTVTTVESFFVESTDVKVVESVLTTQESQLVVSVDVPPPQDANATILKSKSVFFIIVFFFIFLILFTSFINIRKLRVNVKCFSKIEII